jgi:hypothetical protein
VASEDAGGDVDVDVASVGRCDGVREVEVSSTNSSGSEGEGDGGGRGGGSCLVCTDVRGEGGSPSCAMKVVVMSGTRGGPAEISGSSRRVGSPEILDLNSFSDSVWAVRCVLSAPAYHELKTLSKWSCYGAPPEFEPRQ